MTPNREAGISFVVPCFDSGDLLLEAVRSLLDQPTREPFEVIVVDDGSSDAATLRALATVETLGAVRVLRSTSNLGVQHARNRGVGEARFDFVMTLDSDDRLRPPTSGDASFPDQALSILRADDGIAFVHTMSRMFGAFDGLTISAYPCREELILLKHHVPTSIVFRRRDALEGASYDPRIRKWQDWSFAVALLDSRWRRRLPNRIGFVRGPYHDYRVHAAARRLSMNNVDEHEMTLITVDAHLDYFRSYWGSGQSARDIASRVVSAKPSRLIDLLHMAAFDLDQAQAVARQREFELVSPYSGLGIP
ncbi:glycosyltransferase family 2 protein [Sorangium sp. So ce363]|uniref:glycosyltransferase family 2 protein n=1 Tax=Sorangium sp. So ce363 TaxID=3133304 RepID=UPI003F6103BC